MFWLETVSFSDEFLLCLPNDVPGRELVPLNGDQLRPRSVVAVLSHVVLGVDEGLPLAASGLNSLGSMMTLKPPRLSNKFIAQRPVLPC